MQLRCESMIPSFRYLLSENTLNCIHKINMKMAIGILDIVLQADELSGSRYFLVIATEWIPNLFNL